VYNTLTVPHGKRFELKLSDGTQVNLNAGTSLKYPIKFLEGQHRKVFLNGEAFFDVSKDTLHPFVVNADDLDVRVLGTRFNVSSYPEDDRTDVVLIEGSVGMNKIMEDFDKDTSTVLEPGFKGTFQKNSGKIEKKPVTTGIYTAWMSGELVFRNMTFQNILKKMERHYNVSISNTNADLGNEVFNASYGKVTLEKVLKDLKLTHGINYSINQNLVTIN
jgi:ferric-dicitrate binding protein FerR (iron transport regulator)